MIILLIALTIIAWFLVAKKTRYEKHSDFVRGLLEQAMVSFIAGLSMSAVVIGRDPLSIGFESATEKLEAILIITGYYIIFTVLVIIKWVLNYWKWIKQNNDRQEGKEIG
jgi:cytochrome bd-type quinol oxidase subunit 2